MRLFEDAVFDQEFVNDVDLRRRRRGRGVLLNLGAGDEHLIAINALAAAAFQAVQNVDHPIEELLAHVAAQVVLLEQEAPAVNSLRYFMLQLYRAGEQRAQALLAHAVADEQPPAPNPDADADAPANLVAVGDPAPEPELDNPADVHVLLHADDFELVEDAPAPILDPDNLGLAPNPAPIDPLAAAGHDPAAGGVGGDPAPIPQVAPANPALVLPAVPAPAVGAPANLVAAADPLANVQVPPALPQQPVPNPAGLVGLAPGNPVVAGDAAVPAAADALAANAPQLPLAAAPAALQPAANPVVAGGLVGGAPIPQVDPVQAAIDMIVNPRNAGRLQHHALRQALSQAWENFQQNAPQNEVGRGVQAALDNEILAVVRAEMNVILHYVNPGNTLHQVLEMERRRFEYPRNEVERRIQAELEQQIAAAVQTGIDAIVNDPQNIGQPLQGEALRQALEGEWWRFQQNPPRNEVDRRIQVELERQIDAAAQAEIDAIETDPLNPGQPLQGEALRQALEGEWQHFQQNAPQNEVERRIQVALEPILQPYRAMAQLALDRDVLARLNAVNAAKVLFEGDRTMAGALATPALQTAFEQQMRAALPSLTDVNMAKRNRNK